MGKSRIGEVRRKTTGREGITATSRKTVRAICENKKKGVAPALGVTPFSSAEMLPYQAVPKAADPFFGPLRPRTSQKRADAHRGAGERRPQKRKGQANLPLVIQRHSGIVPDARPAPAVDEQADAQLDERERARAERDAHDRAAPAAHTAHTVGRQQRQPARGEHRRMRAAAVKQLGRAVKHAADGEHRQRAAKRLHNKKPRIRAFTVSFPQSAFFYAKTAGKSFRRIRPRSAPRSGRKQLRRPAFFYKRNNSSRRRGRSKSRTKPKKRPQPQRGIRPHAPPEPRPAGLRRAAEGRRLHRPCANRSRRRKRV